MLMCELWRMTLAKVIGQGKDRVLVTLLLHIYLVTHEGVGSASVHDLSKPPTI